MKWINGFPLVEWIRHIFLEKKLKHTGKIGTTLLEFKVLWQGPPVKFHSFGSLLCSLWNRNINSQILSKEVQLPWNKANWYTIDFLITESQIIDPKDNIMLKCLSSFQILICMMSYDQYESKKGTGFLRFQYTWYSLTKYFMNI